jgi:YHS domain-containing protein
MKAELSRCWIVAVLLCTGTAAVAEPASRAQRIASRWEEPNSQEKPLPLAAGGFCVVTLRDRQQWQPGDPSLAAAFDGQEYRFATQREMDIFVAGPDAYAPVLAGDCVVTLFETSKRTAGLLELGVVHRDRLYFFASEEQRQKFLDEPRRYDQADIAIGGRCPVSRRERRLEVPGMPATAAVHDGWRFLFASAHERALFLANPAKYDGTQNDRPLAPPPIPKPNDSAQKLADGQRRRLPSGQRRGAFGDGKDAVVLGTLPAMAGYCPVTLKEQGLWVRGRYENRVDLGGLVLLTAGEQQKKALLSDPLAYIPVLGGDCPVTYQSRHEHVRGSVFQAVDYQGRLYLFADADRKAAFKANPAPYVDIDVAEKGLCIVTRVDAHRDVPGLAEQALWYKGRVYRFAGAEQKKKFLENPTRYAVDADK